MRAWPFLLLPFFGCTVVSTARLPGGPQAQDVFVLSGDLHQPYDSLGPIQATRKGVLVFGFADPAGTDLESGMADLVEELHRMGADGAINVHYEQSQYLPATRALFAVLFFIPLPTHCTLSGEAVKLKGPARPVPGMGL
jgi:hypothetical protein